MKKRILFPKNKQKQFLENTVSNLDITWQDLAKKMDVNINTFSKTYRFEKSRIPEKIFLKLCSLLNADSKEILKLYNGKITNDGNIRIRKVLGETRTKINNIKITFRNCDDSLEIRNIKYSNADREKNLLLPNKLTVELAEEIGMHIGDGYLSGKKNDYRLKGNKHDEKEYYNTHVRNLYKKLFNLNIKIKEYDSTYGFEVYSKALHEFKSNVLKLPKGRKSDIRIPEKIKINNSKILASFLRGLFDTDGNIYFQSRYGYRHYYPRISVAQKSEKLIKEVALILKMLGFRPSIYVGKEATSVSLHGYNSLKHFMDIVGFNNPKHLKKVRKWEEMYPKI